LTQVSRPLNKQPGRSDDKFRDSPSRNSLSLSLLRALSLSRSPSLSISFSLSHTVQKFLIRHPPSLSLLHTLTRTRTRTRTHTHTHTLTLHPAPVQRSQGHCRKALRLPLHLRFPQNHSE